MIKYAHGNLLLKQADALVNTVNTVGVMGKGIALQFKQAFPENFDAYEKACRRGEVMPGKMFVFERNALEGPRLIINFPTKRHWRQPARLTDIEAGLVDLVRVLKEHHVRSVAVPPLGCGNGGLSWGLVRPLIEGTLGTIRDVNVFLFGPTGTPDVEEMPVNTKKPRLTPVRAALIAAMANYAIPGYRLTMLEVQKLAYLLQAAGQPLRLNFVKEKYGPYAENLNKVLERLEGHYLRGFGDRSRNASIRVLPEAEVEAHKVLSREIEFKMRLARIQNLCDGFETPYGMELLTTTHWAAHDDLDARVSSDGAVGYVHAWSSRKQQTFRREHILLAWNQLRNQGWLAARRG
jgi:O-acetyl-ADP-ribose deacetylase (regulator of RNase III)